MNSALFANKKFAKKKDIISISKKNPVWIKISRDKDLTSITKISKLVIEKSEWN